MRRALLAVWITLSLLLAACGGDSAEPAATDTGTETTEAASPSPTATEAPSSPSPTVQPPGMQWPTDDVSAQFTGTVPPVPTLVEIRVGTHPDEGYDRVAFEFDSLPGYRIGYQQQIVYDGSGKPVQLAGDAFIQLVFNPAHAHDDDGNPTLSSPPVDPVSVGYPALEAYVLNGDFEGYVSVALGLTGELGFRVGHFSAQNGNEVVYIDVAQP